MWAQKRGKPYQDETKNIKPDDNTFVYIMSFWFITDIRQTHLILFSDGYNSTYAYTDFGGLNVHSFAFSFVPSVAYAQWIHVHLFVVWLFYCSLPSAGVGFEKWEHLKKSVALLHNFICLLILMPYTEKLSTFGLVCQCRICLGNIISICRFSCQLTHISLAHKLLGVAWQKAKLRIMQIVCWTSIN